MRRFRWVDVRLVDQPRMAQVITAGQLCAIMPMSAARVKLFLDPLNAAMSEFEINTAARQAAFLAQIAHESGQLSRLSENLNYSADGLANTWPNRFAAKDIHGNLAKYASTKKYIPNLQARTLHRKPEPIANCVYANRMGNGPASSGDGWLYRGAGLVQLTGKNNQHACARHFHIDPPTVGDWLRTPTGACRSAAWFWKSHGCNQFADDGDFLLTTTTINGGLNGHVDRGEFWVKAKSVLCAA